MGDMSREPSMEEILSSIRRVIARDESALVGGGPADDTALADGAATLSGFGAASRGNAARQLTPMHGGDADDDDDVLELTDAEADVEAADSAADPGESPPLQTATPEPVIASFPMPSTKAAASRETPSGQTGPVAPSALVSQVSAAASRQSLDALAAALAGGGDATEVAPPATPGGDLSVNALVDAAVRPMLKEWLDAHLPQMVERLVAREIARITGNRL